MITVRYDNLKAVSQDRRVVEFDKEARHGKITGSRFLAVLGRDKYATDFQVACLIGRVFYDDTKTKYTVAGDFLEPVIRRFVRSKCDTQLKDILGVQDEITVEEPVNKNDCYYDHFRREKIFGGMVDGYVQVKKRRYAVLEIKTSSDRSDWFDENGGRRIPEGYYLQASLYAQLSNLDKIVFAVCFLNENDYDNLSEFEVNDGNTLIFCVGKRDITDEMRTASEWYAKYIDAGVTPEWTDADVGLVDELRTYRVKELPYEVQREFKRYVKHMDSEDDLSELEDNLEYVMETIAAENAAVGVDKVVYECDGVLFTYTQFKGKAPGFTAARI